jgi:ATP-dependent helicase HepA
MIGIWIRERRKNLKLTQSALAARVGVSQVQISCWETQKLVPSPSHVEQLIAVLGPIVATTARVGNSTLGPPSTALSMRAPAKPHDVGYNVGNFVRVDNTRDGIAKLMAVEGEVATVEYFDSIASQIRRSVPTNALQRVSLPTQTRCYWLNGGHWRVGRIRERLPDGYRVVSQQQDDFVAEADLFVRWAHPLADPTEVLATQGNESPLFHRSRLAFVETVIEQRAASRGLTGVLSARTELHSHQVETARRVLEDPIPRYILADEVGLGKTIEAGFVIRQFLLDSPDARVLVLVPPFLVRQWREELESKFHIGDFGSACRVEAYTSGLEGRKERVDFLVIDEAHHLAAYATVEAPALRNLYTRAANLASEAPRLLLLSATPLLHNEAAFLAMLHLVDAASYPLNGYDAFRARVAARALLGRVLLGFTEETPSFLLDQPLADLRALFPDDARLFRLLDAVEATSEASDEERAACIRAVRVHLSETHRIYRRLLRTRRSEELADTFPVRGRDGARVVLAPDDDRAAADAWLEGWRETVLLDAATETDSSVRRDREADLARVFKVLLPRACSSVKSLVAAARYRVHGDSNAAAAADLTSAEAETLRRAVPCVAEAEALGCLLERFEEFGPDARVEAAASLLAARDGCKVVVFASYRCVAAEMHARFAARFGTEYAARFTADMPPEDVDAEVARFRSDVRCRVLVCDESGEEGRNLQFADLLVHYDLPWSPNRLEQRIGRLDRYGEGATVECVVFSDTPNEYTFHDRWRMSLAEDFQLFSRSVAAFQFAIDAAMPNVWDALFQGSAGAFDALAPKIRAMLDAESQAIAEQDVLDSIEAVDRDVTFFNGLEACDGRDAALREGFNRWAGVGSGEQASLQLACAEDPKNSRIVEYRPILQTAGGRQTLVPSDLLLRWFPAGRVRGTFTRNTAIRKSDARLLRIGVPFYDQVCAFGEWDDRGRAFALWRYRPVFAVRDPDWAFRFDFIVEADPEPALSFVEPARRGDLASRMSLQRRLDGLLPPFLRTVWIDAAGNLVVDALRLKEFAERYDKQAGDVNLRPARFERASRVLRLGDWPTTCRLARQRSEALLRDDSDFVARLATYAASATRLLDGRVESMRARAERANASPVESREAEREGQLARALLAGIVTPRVRLEAIGFVCLAGVLPAEVEDDA